MIKQLKIGDICPLCGEVMTESNRPSRDHVIPKWLVSRIPIFTGKALSLEKMQKIMDLPRGNVRIICRDCNTKKGGNLDYSDPVTRHLVLEIIEFFSKSLNK